MIIRLFFILFFLNYSAFSSEEFVALPAKKSYWKFDGIFGSFNKQSIQRGYQVYKEVCSACHSINKLYFRNLTEVGFSVEEVKSLASSYKVTDGPNDQGEMYERSGIPSDRFISPFANKELAMLANNGAVPPDLSLIVKARHNGSNYIYSLLTGYTNSVADSDGLYENKYFTTGRIAMAPPLSDDIVQYINNDVPATVENMAYDVVNFLHWAAEPEMENRKNLGLKVLGFCIIITIMFYLYNIKLWKELYKKTAKK